MDDPDTMVEIPLGLLQRYELLLRAATALYDDHSHGRPISPSRWNELGAELSVIHETRDDDGWEVWRVDRENDRLTARVEALSGLIDDIAGLAADEMARAAQRLIENVTRRVEEADVQEAVWP